MSPSFCALSLHCSSRIRIYKMDTEWELICYNKPYYQRVCSASKTGNDTYPFVTANINFTIRKGSVSSQLSEEVLVRCMAP